MVKELKERGWDVYGYDLKDGDDVVDYFRDIDEDFDLVVHCAYVVGGREHIDGTNLALASNIQLDGSMFQWALTNEVAVIYYSSSAAYPVEYQSKGFTAETGGRRLREGDIHLPDPGTPDSLYGWAKLTGEKLAQKFTELGGRVHVLRPFSGYATDQDLTYPFPSIVKRVKAGDLSVWGPPGQTRDWIHIEDVVNGSLEIYHQDVREPINLCTGRPTEFGELARSIYRQSSGKHDGVVKYLEGNPTGVFYRVGDPTELLKYFEPKISLEEGIARALK
jgi:nucleoside-diphosphate-sugar epimerase